MRVKNQQISFSLMILGISLFLVSSLLPLQVIAFGVGAEEGFESTLSNWTIETNNGGTVAISGDNYFQGTRSLKTTSNGTGTINSKGAISTRLSSHYKTLFIRFYVYIDSISGGYFLLFSSVRSTTTMYLIADIGVRYDRSLGVVYTTNGDPNDIYIYSATTLPLKQWVELEYMVTYGNGNGAVKVWYEGELVDDLNLSGLNNSHVGGGGGDFIGLGTWRSHLTSTIFVDTVKIDTNYINSIDVGTFDVAGVAKDTFSMGEDVRIIAQSTRNPITIKIFDPNNDEVYSDIAYAYTYDKTISGITTQSGWYTVEASSSMSSVRKNFATVFFNVIPEALFGTVSIAIVSFGALGFYRFVKRRKIASLKKP